MTKLKFKSDSFKSFNKSILINFFIKFFVIVFFICIKMSKNLSAKYYQENKERLQKKLMKGIKIFLKKKKRKSSNIVMNNTKIYQKMKKKSLLSLEKNIIE